jgi:hypothetical protein
MTNFIIMYGMFATLKHNMSLKMILPTPTLHIKKKVNAIIMVENYLPHLSHK